MATQVQGTDQNFNQQIQAMHALAQQGKLNVPAMLPLTGGSMNTAPKPLAPVAPPKPVNPAATSVKPPLGTPAPVTNMPPTPTQQAPSQQAGTQMPSSSSPAASAAPAPSVPGYADQLKALQAAQQANVSSYALSPDILNTQNQLNDITSKQAMLQANEKAGEANVMDQPIAMPFIGGQQAGLQRQLAALQGQESAQAVPLQTKLALYQMQREAAQQSTQAQEDAYDGPDSFCACRADHIRAETGALL